MYTCIDYVISRPRKRALETYTKQTEGHFVCIFLYKRICALIKYSIFVCMDGSNDTLFMEMSLSIYHSRGTVIKEQYEYFPFMHYGQN